MIGLALAGLLAALWVHRQAALPAPEALLAACLLALILGLLLRLRAPARVWPLARFLLWVGAGAAMALWASGSAALHLAEVGKIPGHGAVPAEVELRVVGLATRLDPPGWRFEAEIVSVRAASALAAAAEHAQALAQASAPEGRVWAVVPGHLPEPLAGQTVRGLGQIRAIHGLRNAVGFDFETWAFEKGLIARVSFKAVHVQEPAGGLGLRERIDRARSAARRTMSAALEGQPHRGVMLGLTLGDQAAISAEDWALFSATGISHLVSISGSHITVFAWLAQTAIALLWGMAARLGSPWALWLPTPVVSAVVGCSAAWAYALFAGFGLPAQRTAAMVMAVSLAGALGWRSNAWGGLAAAALSMLLVQPSAVLSPGFWLSFVAVALLFGRATEGEGGTGRAGSRAGWLRASVDAQATVTLGLAAWTIVFFSQVSLVGPAVNALAIPAVGLLITPLALLGMAMLMLVGWADPLVWVHAAWDWVHAGVAWAGNLSWAQAIVVLPSPWMSVPALVGPMIALHRRLPRWRHLGWIALLPMFLLPLLPSFLPPLLPSLSPGPSSPLARPAWGEFHVDVWDVGQGSALAVLTQGHQLLVDVGPASSGRSVAEQVIVPALRQRGVGRLDGLLLSHGDEDHVGGLGVVLKHLQPTWRLGNLRPNHPEAQAMERCRAGQGWIWDGVRFEILGPAEDAAPRAWGTNADSCSLRVTSQAGHSFWTLGDMPSLVEWDLIHRLAIQPAAGTQAILMAVHHGSKSSNSEALLRAIRPSVWVSQSAHQGRFRHPDPGVVGRAAASGAQVLRTDLLGGLVLAVGGRGVQWMETFTDARRFWHRPRSAPYTAPHDDTIPSSAENHRSPMPDLVWLPHPAGGLSGRPTP